MKYSLSPREIPRAKPKGFPEGLCYISSYFLIRVTIQTFSITKSSIDLPGRSILEEVILHIASTAGQYGKILSSRLSNTEEVNFNIIMFSCELN